MHRTVPSSCGSPIGSMKSAAAGSYATGRPAARSHATWCAGLPTAERSAAVRRRPVSARTRNAPFDQSRMKSRSYQPSAIMTAASPSASAPSVPGRTRSH